MSPEDPRQPAWGVSTVWGGRGGQGVGGQRLRGEAGSGAGLPKLMSGPAPTSECFSAFRSERSVDAVEGGKLRKAECWAQKELS